MSLRTNSRKRRTVKIRKPKKSLQHTKSKRNIHIS